MNEGQFGLITDPVALRSVWMRCRNDPVYMVNTLLATKTTGEVEGRQVRHLGQENWLRQANRPINVLVPGNRWGKSTVIAMRHIWHCLFKIGLPSMSQREWLAADYNTISAAMSGDQAEIVFKTARAMLQHPVIKPLVSKVRATPFPAITFYNGATFHCRSAHDDAKYIDGHAYRYLSLDEAGYIPNLKHLMTSVLVMRLAGGGMIDLIGTPKGYNDLYFYWERGHRRVKGYYSQRGSIYDNPFLPEDDIRMRDDLLASANEKVRRQVLFGDFVDFEGLAFTRDQMDNAFDPELPTSQPPRQDRRYVVAFDLGRTTDYTVGIVLDITQRPWVLVEYIRLNKVAWETIYGIVGETRRRYMVRWAYIDATGPMGDVVEEELTKRGIPVEGVRVNTRNLKVELINRLQTALDEGRQVTGTYDTVDESGNRQTHPSLEEPGEGDWGLLRMPTIVQLMDEMGVYMLDDKELTQDSVFALALAVQAAYEFEGLSPPLLQGLY